MKSQPKYQRDGAEPWISAAYAILVAEGHGGLTIEKLTAQTGKTRGSFYHHFGSHRGFIARVLDDWYRQHTEQIERLIAAAPKPRQRRAILNREASKIDGKIEAAFRRWAGANPVVAQAYQAVDQRRIALIARDLTALAASVGVLLIPEKARALAVIDYAIYLGAQMLAPDGRLDALPDVLPTIEDMLDVYLRQLPPTRGAANANAKT